MHEVLANLGQARLHLHHSHPDLFHGNLTRFSEVSVPDKPSIVYTTIKVLVKTQILPKLDAGHAYHCW